MRQLTFRQKKGGDFIGGRIWGKRAERGGRCEARKKKIGKNERIIGRDCQAEKSRYPARALKTFLTVLVIIAIVLIECMIGGTRLVFSLPMYGVIALAAVIGAFKRPTGAGRPSAWCLGIAAVFFSYILVRAWNSPTPYLRLTDYFMVMGCLMVYLLTTMHLTGMRQRKAVIGALLGLAIIEVFIGLRQFSVGDEWMPFGFLRATSGRRASGMLISSIHLAGYLETMGAFALAFAIWSTWKNWARFLAGYIAVMCYLGIAITGSRGGYLSAVFSLLVFTGFSLHIIKRVRPARFARTAWIVAGLVVVFIGAAVALMQTNEMIRGRLTLLTNQLEKNKLDIRIYNWQATLDQFRERPVFGTGAGTHIYYGRFYRRPELQPDPIHAHSDYLELLAEYGVAGAVGMLAFLGIHLGMGLRSYRTVLQRDLRELGDYEPARHNWLALYVGAICAIAAMAAHSAVDFNLHIPGHALIFAFIFGLLASPVYGVTGQPRSVWWWPPRFALGALGLGFLAVGFPRFPGEYWAEKSRVALRNWEFAQAIEYGKRSYALDDDNPEQLFTLGGAYRGAGLTAENREERIANLESAAETYQKALRLFPEDEHTLVRIGETFADLGRFREAEASFRAAIALDRNHGILYAYLASYLASVGRVAEAEEAMTKARSLANNDLSPIYQSALIDPELNEF